MYDRYCFLRDSKGLKDADVARITGITPSTFSDWKKAKSTPNVTKLILIANLLGVTVEYLVTGKESEASERPYRSERRVRPTPHYLSEQEETLLFAYEVASSEVKQMIDAAVRTSLQSYNEKKEAAESTGSRRATV